MAASNVGGGKYRHAGASSPRKRERKAFSLGPSKSRSELAAALELIRGLDMWAMLEVAWDRAAGNDTRVPGPNRLRK
jgi:hypothetical protein